jgi:hypothetical protein
VTRTALHHIPKHETKLCEDVSVLQESRHTGQMATLVPPIRQAKGARRSYRSGHVVRTVSMFRGHLAKEGVY